MSDNGKAPNLVNPEASKQHFQFSLAYRQQCDTVCTGSEEGSEYAHLRHMGSQQF